MTAWRDLQDVRRPIPLDDWTADRLLAGMVDPDDAPPGYAGLARVLDVVHGPAEAGELAGRELIVAAVAAAVVAGASHPAISQPARRRPMLYRLFATKVAAATMTTALLATGAAAATGSLPDVAQSVVSDAADVVGVTLPDGGPEKVLPASEKGRSAHELRDARHEAKDAEKAAKEAAKAEARTAKDGAEAGEPEAGDVAGEEQPEKATPASQAGQDAHTVRDLRHDGDEGWKDERDRLRDERKADEDAPAEATEAGSVAGDDEPEKVTPASEEGQAAHVRRDERHEAHDAEKAAENPGHSEDETDKDDADEADDDESGDKGNKGKHDEDDDVPATLPTV